LLSLNGQGTLACVEIVSGLGSEDGSAARPPIIYTRVVMPPPLTLAGRLAALAVGCGCLSVLLVAAWLRPNANGAGTHTQLGMPSCQFMRNTGLPCPSCGMTTSFAYFAHGKVLASVITQPMGAVLALLAAAGAWVGLYIALTGRPVHRLMRFVPSRYYLMPLLVLALLAWGWKIFLTLHRLGGWK